MAGYNLRYPVNQKDTYSSGDNVDLVLSFPGMSLIGNSVRLSGVLNVYKDFANPRTPVAVTDKIYYDAATGINSFINNVVVSSFNKGTIETQSDYPRWVKMKHTATRTASEMVSNSKLLTQLICQDDSLTPALMTGPLPFVVDVDCCVNNVIANQDNPSAEVPYATTGDITLSFRVCQVIEALYGDDVNANVNFTLSKLACEYLTMMPSPKAPSVVMLSCYSIKQIINSSNAVVNVKLPAVINKMSASFMKVSEELQNPYNNLALERPRGMNKLYYTLNDSTNMMVSYPLETIEDILEHYLESFISPDKDIKKNNATLRKINDDKLFGVGLDLEGNFNLTNTSLGVNILSDVQSNDPYYIYAYFKGVIQM